MSQTFNKKSPTVKRILREAAELAASPSPDYHAVPLDSNLFEWHFTLRGPPSTPYASGIYHGRITLPPQYPLRPPSFRFLTPSGRFEVNREICLSISGHHEDTWQPAWGVRTAVVALRGFMEGEAGGQVGGMECSNEVREKIAGESATWKCEGCGGQSCEEILKESAARAKELEDAGKAAPDEVLPEGLKLAYKDEMKKAGEGETGEEAGSSDTPIPTPTNSEVPSTPTTPAPPVAPIPQQQFYQHQQYSSPAPPPPPYQPYGQQQQPNLGGAYLPGQIPAYLHPMYAPPPVPVPAAERIETPWLDKFIWALVVALAALVARRYWGLELIV